MAFYKHSEAQRIADQRVDKIEQLKQTVRFLLTEISHAISICPDEKTSKHLSETLTNKRFITY